LNNVPLASADSSEYYLVGQKQFTLVIVDTMGQPIHVCEVADNFAANQAATTGDMDGLIFSYKFTSNSKL
jgi:hypothetical protein